MDISWKPFNDEHVKFIKIYRSENGKTFIPVGIQSPLVDRYADFTGITGKRYSYKITLLVINIKKQGFRILCLLQLKP